MIVQKEFYFVRHGETDHNAGGDSGEQGDMPLNENGRFQALKIEPLIAAFPLKTVCYSPLKRVKETKEILTSRLLLPQHEIPDLAECSFDIWKELIRLGSDALGAKGPLQFFLERVRRGINHALSEEGPVLIIAHGGVHFAFCCMMAVEHEWVIDNCVPVHFIPKETGGWSAKKLL